MKRADMMARCLGRQDPWDMVIVGGGATGMGVAVDAASRGYDVSASRAAAISERALPAAAPNWCTAACAIWSKAISRW